MIRSDGVMCLCKEEAPCPVMRLLRAMLVSKQKAATRLNATPILRNPVNYHVGIARAYVLTTRVSVRR